MGKDGEKERERERERLCAHEKRAIVSFPWNRGDPPFALLSRGLSAFRNIREEKLENVRKTTMGRVEPVQDFSSWKFVYLAGARARSTLIDITAGRN